MRDVLLVSVIVSWKRLCHWCLFLTFLLETTIDRVLGRFGQVLAKLLIHYHLNQTYDRLLQSWLAGTWFRMMED